MGIYARRDSPYWWLWLERPGQRALKKSSKIPREGDTPERTKQLRQDAYDAYLVEMANLARARYELPIEQPERDGVTFTAFATWYAETKQPHHRGRERETELLAQLLPFFGRYPLGDIDRHLVETYLTKRTVSDGKKASTANREVDVLKSILAAAVPRYLKASPIAGMPRLRMTKIRKRVVEADEEPRLLAQLTPRDQVLYIACVDTLARLGNILNLKRSDDRRTLLDFLDSKTGPYAVPVSARLRAGLDSLPVGPTPKTRPYYFWWRRKAATERDRRGGIRQMLSDACARAGIPYGRAIAGITWHTGTRATGATRMLRKGADPATVQGVGHWASLQQMSEYLQTTTPLQQAAVDLIGADTDLEAARQAGEAAKAARASRKPDVSGRRRKATKRERSRRGARSAKGGKAA